MLKNIFQKYGSSSKTLAWGIVWIVGAIWFWLYLAGNPFDELALILNGKITSGFITNTWEDVEDGDDGRAHWYYSYSYKFVVPDGRYFQNTVHSSGRLKEDFQELSQPYPIEVEYLSSNPNVSRIKGDGNSSVFEWLWRKIGIGGLLLILFISPGIVLIRDGIREIKKIPKSNIAVL